MDQHAATNDTSTTPGRVSLSAAASAVTGTLWALALALLGLWLLFSSGWGAPVPRGIGVPLGLTFFLSAQYVFLTLVADKAFPDAPPTLTRRVESGVLAAAGLGSAAVVVTLVAGGAS